MSINDYQVLFTADLTPARPLISEPLTGWTVRWALQEGIQHQQSPTQSIARLIDKSVCKLFW